MTKKSLKTVIGILSYRAIWITITLGIIDTIIKTVMKLDPVTAGSDILLGILGMIFFMVAYEPIITQKLSYVVVCLFITLTFWLISLYLISEDFINQIGFTLVREKNSCRLVETKPVELRLDLWHGYMCPGTQFVINMILSLLCVFLISTLLQVALLPKKR